MSRATQQPLSELPYAHGKPRGSGVIRSYPDDFSVDEELSFPPDHEGHHVLVRIEKRDANTQWVAGHLARFAGVSKVDVGYAGLKDRHAVTRQWFSVHLPGKDDTDWDEFQSDHWRVLSVARHGRKLRPGCVKRNRFKIVVRDVDADPEDVITRLGKIHAEGVPNYFGEQRFGRDNMANALAWLAGAHRVKNRHVRSIYMSTVRAALFNKVLAGRILRRTWNQLVTGDVAMLQGSNSVFTVEQVTAALTGRCRQGDICPTGPLWGSGDTMTRAEARELETRILEGDAELRSALEALGLKQQRRSLAMCAQELEWSLDLPKRVLEASFCLRAGSYATVLLREVLCYGTLGGSNTECY